MEACVGASGTAPCVFICDRRGWQQLTELYRVNSGFFNVRMFLQSLWPGLHAPARQHAHTHSINQNFKQSQNPGGLTSQISHQIETVARVLKPLRPIKAFPKKIQNTFF